MLDFYGLGRGFPGMPLPANLANIEKVNRIEQAVKADIVAQLPEIRADVRFLPYLQLHEYEGLLFSDPVAFARGIYAPNLAVSFQHVRNEFPTPEDINDGPDTAPSKRVIRLSPGYRKPLHGTLAALEVGVDRMRQECPHFREWAGGASGKQSRFPAATKLIHRKYPVGPESKCESARAEIVNIDSCNPGEKITTVGNLSKVSTSAHNQGVADELRRKWSQQ
jgi:hypothetical protein